MLEIISKFLNETKHLRWCQWKNNFRIYESLNGLTDLDILIDPLNKLEFKKQLIKFNFIQFNSLPWVNYKNIENWIGFDSATGKLVDFHIHEKIKVGFKSFKCQSIPWQNKILENKVKSNYFDFPMVSPPIETQILLASELSKISFLWFQANKNATSGGFS